MAYLGRKISRRLVVPLEHQVVGGSPERLSPAPASADTRSGRSMRVKLSQQKCKSTATALTTPKQTTKSLTPAS